MTRLKDLWKEHKRTVLGVLAAFMLIVVFYFAARDKVLTWWYDSFVVEPSTNEAVDLQPEIDWLSCVYNCGLQIDPMPPGRCIRICDTRFSSPREIK